VDLAAAALSSLVAALSSVAEEAPKLNAAAATNAAARIECLLMIRSPDDAFSELPAASS
jgi:hypothetical protein